MDEGKSGLQICQYEFRVSNCTNNIKWDSYYTILFSEKPPLPNLYGLEDESDSEAEPSPSAAQSSSGADADVPADTDRQFKSEL
jgi:hypothetical protein